MSSTHSITSAEQLLHATDLGRCELVRGVLKMMSPAGFEHGRIAARLAARLVGFVEERDLGIVVGAETGFRIARDPDTVRAPDVAFIRRRRLPSGPMTGFFPGAPDLAVEILSPDDRAGQVLAKVRDWLAAGCEAVWVVDPGTRSVSVYGPSGGARVLGPDETLDGGEVLPQFALPTAEIFAAQG
jgi:Uma2 family endonuclease